MAGRGQDVDSGHAAARSTRRTASRACCPWWASSPRSSTADGRTRTYTTVTGETAESRYIFHRNGGRIGDFRKAWTAACIAAGFAKPKLRRDGRPVLDRKGQPVMRATLIFHDLRRSAVRNLVAAGVNQSVAMRATGHQTTSVFQRYRIVFDDDVRAALERTQAALANVVEGPAPAGQGHNSGHEMAAVIHSPGLSR